MAIISVWVHSVRVDVYHSAVIVKTTYMIVVPGISNMWAACYPRRHYLDSGARNNFALKLAVQLAAATIKEHLKILK